MGDTQVPKWRLWYIHTSARRLDPVGVFATQVIERIRVLSRACDVGFLSVEAQPIERDWTEVFPEPNIDARTVPMVGLAGTKSLLLPRNSAVREVLGIVLDRSPRAVDIFHCRSQWSALVGAGVVRRLRARGREAAMVYDMEGVAAEEVRYAAEAKKESGVSTRLRTWFQQYLEGGGLRRAEGIICVSRNMSEFIHREYGIPRSRIRVVQSTANSDLFFADPEAGRATRHELDIPMESTVLMYNGSFALYQRPDLFLTLFRHVLDANADAILLVVSRQVDQAREIVQEAGLPAEKVRLASTSYDQMRRYLNAADWGLCLRDDDIVNRAASPTKVAEYLCCGTPVIVTPYTGDYGSIVSEQKLGIVVTPSEYGSSELRAISSRVPATDRERCAAWAGANLTHQSALDTYWRLYKELASR